MTAYGLIDPTWYESAAIQHFVKSHEDSYKVWAEDEVIDGFRWYHKIINKNNLSQQGFIERYFPKGIDAYYECYYRSFKVCSPNANLGDFFDFYWQRHMKWENKHNETSTYSNNKIKTLVPVVSYKKERVVITPPWKK